MIYLCLIFMPPVYFLTRRKWGGFILNSMLYGMACFLVLTILFIEIAPVFWILSVGHAAFVYRRELIESHANLMATKMAEKLAETLRNEKK